MKFLCLISMSICAIAATVPDRFLVQLSGEPAATHAVRVGHRAPAADPAFRARVSALKQQHLRMRAALEAAGAVVIGETSAVANVMIVRIPADRAAALASIPGVVRVHPVRMFYRTLDHALPLERVPDAWNQIGGQSSAGVGMMIGMIDTGMDSGHPPLNDPTLTPPNGFPLVNQASDVAYTNNKIIVARSYAINSDGTNAPAIDTDGHGTGTSTVVAGAPVSDPIAPISGVPPKAFLGNYKVFPDDSTGAEEDWIISAIDDAFTDGMNIINLSLGSTLAERPADDLLAQAVETATSAGVIVTVSAGNSGSDPNTIASPGVAPDAITVGSSWNDRDFAGVLQPASGPALAAYPGNGPNTTTPISAPLVDVTQFDPTDQACSSLPANSLTGMIALIFRGVCTFETKIDNAQQAGAVAVVVYTDAARPDPFTMSVGAASLPAALVSYEDGASLEQQLAGGSFQVTIDFNVQPVAVSPNRLSSFSSLGPNSDLGIKPDIVAVGEPVNTASLNASFVVESGTSFSAPMVAGAAALLEAARPGLTSSQYGSLLINSAVPIVQDSGAPLTIQQSGAGFLNVLNALNSNIAVAPASISFGASSGSVNQTSTLTVTNIGAASDTFSINVQPIGNGPVPTLSSNSVAIDPGQSQAISVNFTGSSLDPGAYQGYLQIQGTQNSVIANVSYWYGVPSGTATHVTVLEAPTNGDPRSVQTIFVRPVDDQGLAAGPPTVTVTSGNGAAIDVQSIDSIIPGAYGILVHLAEGSNTFTVASGLASTDIVIQSP
jgi:minor extracellular serine protease Vpr